MRSQIKMLRRNLGHLYHLNMNRLRKNTFVPHPRSHMCIEPASYCNLACKFCSYAKDVRPRRIMPTTDFINYVDQAIDMGFRTFVLTPMTGDVFMDRDLTSKLQYLEQNDDVDSVVFYTNLIGASEQSIAFVCAMKKLKLFEISIYGHDLESFKAITGAGKTQYNRLLANLTLLLDHARPEKHGDRIVLAFSTYNAFAFPGDPPSDLCAVLVELQHRLGIEIGAREDYDSWGGLITKDDVRGIDVNLIDGRYLYKKGPCQLLFAYVQIMADGRVNACACRDAGGSLVIGDLAEQPLKDIISNRNANYMDLIGDQAAGKFQNSCRSCTFYRSVYDHRPGAQPISDLGLIQMDAFFDSLGESGV